MSRAATATRADWSACGDVETGDRVTVKAAISTASTAGWAAAGPGSPGSRLFDFEDTLRPDRIGDLLRLRDRRRVSTEQVAQAMLEWEHDMSPLVGQRFRVLALLNLTVNQ